MAAKNSAPMRMKIPDTAMKQKISVELAGLEGYMQILAELEQDPELPVPLLPSLRDPDPS